MKKGQKGISLLLTATLAVSGLVSVPAVALADEPTPSASADVSQGTADFDGASSAPETAGAEAAAPAQDEEVSGGEAATTSKTEEGAPAAQAAEAAPATETADAPEDAAAAEDTAVHVSDYAALKDAIAKASKDAANPTVIVLDADIDATVTTGLTIAAGTFVEISSAAGTTHVFRQNSSGMMTTNTQGMFVVNGSLRLSNITVDVNLKARGVYVGNTGVFTMDEGATITRGAATGTSFKQGLGVYVSGTAALQGIFVMNDGAKISDCQTTLANSQAQGLGVCVYGGYFEMNGGEICNNVDKSKQSTATNYAQGGGVFVYSAASAVTSVLNDKDNFVMNGGSIHDNEANAGAGVFFSNYAHANLKAGTIKANTARLCGGGLAQFMGTESTSATLRAIDILVEEGVEIVENTAVNGGGIYAETGTLEIRGARIADNVATTDQNKIPADWNSSAFTMPGGSAGTTLADSDASVASGGGLYVASATVRIADANITGNRAVSTYQASGESDETLYPAGNGGGLFLAKRKGAEVEHSVRIVDGTIAGNVASGVGAESGWGGDVCASFNPYDGGSDELYLTGTVPAEDATDDERATCGLRVGDLGVVNSQTFRVQEFAAPVIRTAYAAPVVAISGDVTLSNTVLPVPVEEHLEATAALYVLDEMLGTVTVDAAHMPVGAEVLVGANGYLLRTADLNRTAASEGTEGKAFGFNEVGNIVVVDEGESGCDIAAAKVDVGACSYTGEALMPAVTVTLGEKVLEPGTDYSLAYGDNVEAGTAKVVVNGRGAYAGTVESTFEIAPRPLSADGVTFAPIEAYYAADEAIEPTVAGTDGERDLAAGEDFTVTYRDNVAAGTAYAVVSGQGNYTGTVEVPFEIKAIPETMTLVRTEEQLRAALADAAVEGVALGADIALAEPLEVGRLLALDGNGHKITYAGVAEAAITVLNGGDVTAFNLTVSCSAAGSSTKAGEGTRPVRVEAGGRAVLRKATLEGKKNAAGLSVRNAGTVELTDVLIKNALNNSATHTLTYDGVLYNEGTMTLGKGVRFENSVSRRGYVFNTGADALLTIDGADLSGSSTPTSSANAFGGALTIAGGKAIMKDGLISRTTTGAAVVVKTGGQFVMNGGEIVDNKQSTWYTGAVFVYSLASDAGETTFTMNGGTIARNVCAASSNKTYAAGGVLISGVKASFVMNDGLIEDNSAIIGGGVTVYQAEFTMNGGVIRNNVAEATGKTATSANGNAGYALGGGVAVLSNGSVRQASFAMNGGFIEGNAASLNPLTITAQIDFDHTGLGGGVYVMGSQFTMTGGSIANNSVGVRGPKAFANAAQGAGVYLADVKANHQADVTLTDGSITGNQRLSNGLPTLPQDGADVYASQWMNLATSATGLPALKVGGDATLGEVKLSGSKIMATVVRSFSEEGGITRLVADGRTTAGSQIGRYAADVAPQESDLVKLGYDSVLGLAQAKDDPAKIVLGVLDLGKPGVEITLDDTVYTGKAINAAGLLNAHVKVSEDETIDLPGLMDIDVASVQNNTEVGTASVHLKGAGNLVCGEADATFVIKPRPLNESGFTLQLGDKLLYPSAGKYTYVGETFEATGQPVKPDVRIALDNLETDDGPAWIDPSLYEVTYGANTEPGTGTVTLTAKDVPGTRWSGSVTVTFDLCGARLDGWTTNLPEKTIYNGSAQYGTSALQVFDEAGTKLALRTDYTALLSSNTNVGTATVKLSGAGKYAKRTRELTFAIVPIDLSQEGAAALSATQFAYTGKAIAAPTRKVNAMNATVTMLSATNLNNNTTIAFTDAEGNAVASNALVDAGKYYAVIAGKPYTTGGVTYENVVGEARIPFYIGLEAISITGMPESGAVRRGESLDLGYAVLPEGSSQTADLTWSSSDPEVAAVDETGHVETKQLGTTTITVSAGGQTSSFTLQVAPATVDDFDIDWGIEDYVFDGTAKEPHVTLSFEGEPLEAGDKYTVSYQNNVHAGENTATVTVTGLGEIGGSLSQTFSIEQADISDHTASLSYTTAIYDPWGTYPDVTVEGLEVITDYWVSYINATQAGNASVLISGRGDYKGTITLGYVIERRDISNEVFLGYVQETYSPYGAVPPVCVPDAHLHDYEVVYLPDRYSVGVHQVIVYGYGNCKGMAVLQYEVLPANIAAATVEGMQSIYAYSGNPITPLPVVGMGGAELYAGWDYAVNYLNNIEEGTATMVLTGIGNYTGTYSRTFLIQKSEPKPPETTENGGDGDEGDDTPGGMIIEGTTNDGSDSADDKKDGGQPSSNAKQTTTPVAPTRSSSGTVEGGSGAKVTIANPLGSSDEDGSDTDAKLEAAAKTAATRTAGAAPGEEGGITATAGTLGADGGRSLNESAIDEDGTALAEGVGAEGALPGDEADISAELIGLIVLLIVAAGLGGFFLYRYLRGRKTQDEETPAVEAADPLAPYRS